MAMAPEPGGEAFGRFQYPTSPFGLFASDLDDVADRLDTAARQTIAKQSVPPDIKEAPTKHRPERSEEE
jgi:hypothetical protein